jgi:hypothetical protein
MEELTNAFGLLTRRGAFSQGSTPFAKGSQEYLSVSQFCRPDPEEWIRCATYTTLSFNGQSSSALLFQELWKQGRENRILPCPACIAFGSIPDTSYFLPLESWPTAVLSRSLTPSLARFQLHCTRHPFVKVSHSPGRSCLVVRNGTLRPIHEIREIRKIIGSLGAQFGASCLVCEVFGGARETLRSL